MIERFKEYFFCWSAVFDKLVNFVVVVDVFVVFVRWNLFNVSVKVKQV